MSRPSLESSINESYITAPSHPDSNMGSGEEDHRLPLKLPTEGSYADAREFLKTLLMRAREENPTGLSPEEEEEFLSSWRGNVDTLLSMKTDYEPWSLYGKAGLVVRDLVDKLRVSILGHN